MTAGQFDAASEQERNEAVALALGRQWDETKCRVCGWKLVPDGKDGCWKSNCSMRPVPKVRADALPDWQGDDGLAFKELWPEIVKIRSEVRLGMILKTPRCFLEPSSDYSGKISSFLTDLSGSSNTWAQAICKAFLELKESNAHQA